MGLHALGGRKKCKQKHEPHKYQSAQLVVFLLYTLHAAVLRVHSISGKPPSFTLSPTSMATPKGKKLALLYFNAANKKDDW